MSRLLHEFVLFGPSLENSRFVAIGSVADGVLLATGGRIKGDGNYIRTWGYETMIPVPFNSPPESIRQYRAKERRDKADRKQARREARRQARGNSSD